MRTTSASVVAVPERRPMFTRDWNISQRIAGWLVAKNVSPNLISILGMAGAIVSGVSLAATRYSSWPRALFLLAVAGIIVRGMGNLLDGMVAVASGRASPYGELFNEKAVLKSMGVERSLGLQHEEMKGLAGMVGRGAQWLPSRIVRRLASRLAR